MSVAHTIPTGGVGEVARLFLKLGTTAFGGSAEHVAIMEDEVGLSLFGLAPAWPLASSAAATAAASFGLWPMFLFFLKVGSVLSGSLLSRPTVAPAAARFL